MTKRNLVQATQQQTVTSALELAAKHIEGSNDEQSPKATRSTDRISISLLQEERIALEDRVYHFKKSGRRDLKISRLARIALKMMLDASDEDILKTAEEVDNLEIRRVMS